MRRLIGICLAAIFLTVPAASAGTDPYKDHRYRLVWRGHTAAAFDKVFGLAADAASIDFDRGITRDAAFEAWASNHQAPESCSIQVFDEAGAVSQTYAFAGCFSGAFEAFSDLDANANTLAIGHLQLRTMAAKPSSAFHRRPVRSRSVDHP